MLVGADGPGREAAQQLAFALRKEGVAVDVDLRSRSVKAQMKHADRANVAYVMVLGSQELEQNEATLKEMGSGNVESVTLDAAGLAQRLTRPV